MHRVGFVWVVGLIASTRDARVKIGLPSILSGIMIDMQGKYIQLPNQTRCCTLYERKMILGGWALEAVPHRRIRRQWLSLQQVQKSSETI